MGLPHTFFRLERADYTQTLLRRNRLLHRIIGAPHLPGHAALASSIDARRAFFTGLGRVATQVSWRKKREAGPPLFSPLGGPFDHFVVATTAFAAVPLFRKTWIEPSRAPSAVFAPDS